MAVYTICNKYEHYVNAAFVLAGMYCVWVCVELCFNIVMILKFMWNFQLYYQRLN